MNTDRLGLLTDCERSALSKILSKYSSGPDVSENDIVTDSNMSGNAKNSFGGPIEIGTDPSKYNHYSGDVTNTGGAASLILSSLHENIHRGQSLSAWVANSWSEKITVLTDALDIYPYTSVAQDMAEKDFDKNPQMLSEFINLVEDCRKDKIKNGGKDCEI